MFSDSTTASRRGISSMGIATLLAVGAVAIVVSLSSLRGLAMRENESHVQTLLRALGESLNREVLAAPGETTPAALGLQALVKANPSLKHNLTDSRWSEDLLFRHGYYVRLQAPSEGQLPQLVAWPSRLGHTGKHRYTWHPTMGVTELTD